MRHHKITSKELLMDSRNSDDGDYSPGVDEAVWDAVRSMYANETPLHSTEEQEGDSLP